MFWHPSHLKCIILIEKTITKSLLGFYIGTNDNLEVSNCFLSCLFPDNIKRARRDQLKPNAETREHKSEMVLPNITTKQPFNQRYIWGL